MNLRTFLSVLLVYRSNFQVLHWMSKGKNFFTLHTKADEYSNEILKDVDVIAEMLLRFEDKIVNYEEAFKIIESDSDHEFLLIESDKLFDTEDFCKYSTKMFRDILTCIEELLDSESIQNPKNVGIKSTLEGMHDKYDLYNRYLVKRLCE